MKLSELNRKVVVDRLRREWHKYRFQRVVRGILDCKPLARGTLPLTVLSMVQSRDTLPYLLALLSFARFVNPSRVVVVCDPSMTEPDLQAIRKMVPHVEFRRAEEFRHAALPVGGCWERLSAITEYVGDSYVIQLDADTVSLSPITEVHDAVASGRGFVLGEQPNQQLVTFDQARAFVAQYQQPNMHIQRLSESVLPDAQVSGTHYVRGCAGFTGFHRAADLKGKMIEFSTQLRRLTGERWSEWGTEQVASNYLVANLHGTSVLPFPAYATPDQLPARPRFLHFIGSQRFENSSYAQVAAEVIRELRQG